MAGTVKNASVKDLVFDDKNYNQGNPFGEGLIEKSFSKHGAGRSILLDKNNRIIAGNKSTQKFSDNGGENVIIVEVTGDTLVAVKRTDIDLDSKQGREMALADNASAKANITWDTVTLSEDWTVDEQKEWGVELNTEFEKIMSDEEIKEEEIKPFKRTHILLSFPPEKMILIQELLQKIADFEFIEYEQSSN